MNNDETYGPERADRLLTLLRALAERIRDLDGRGRLLDAAPELQRLLGNARSELFHYEVRQTYDTPEIAEHRRIVEDAQRADDAEPWRRSPDE
jgi:PAS domain-containing protein